ncbi:MAG: TIGR00341 family protein [Gillisia sp.]
MLYIIHTAADLEEVKEKIIPLIENRDYRLVLYPLILDFNPQENAVFLTYLGDEFLTEFLPRAANNQWVAGILPHPDIKYTIKGLGISKGLEESVKEILETEEPYKLDLLFCNDQPVFLSVNIGDVFVITKDTKRNNFFSEVLHFIRKMRQLPSLSHKPFVLSIDGEKIISTSALGIVVIDHAMSSIISKRLISESSINDGQFDTVILSPQNILELFWFLFRSLLPKNTFSNPPSFIGQIKASNLTIENQSGVEFTIDGKIRSAKTIKFEVVKEALFIKQKSFYISEGDGENEKNSLKIDNLPTGEKKIELTKRKLPLLPRATAEEFEDLFKVLRENAEVTSIFVVMMILSTLIASFGLFGNSSPVIIGAMILAPIISPIVSFAMGMVRYDADMLKTGVVTIIIGTLVSLVFAAAVSLIIPLKVLTPEINARLSPTLLDMGIAIASGIAAAYAHAKAGIAKSLAGVAIAVALVPPLAVAGIGIGWWDWEVFSGAFLLYLTNLAGIIMFAGITFLLLGFAPFKRAKMGLVYTFIIIAIVMVPLSLSFNRIKEEARITRQLEGSVIENVVLKEVKVRFGKTLLVSVKVVSGEPIQAIEMRRVKAEIEDRIGRPITLEVVSAIEF